MEICTVGADPFHDDGQTDRHETGDSRFSQFCERSVKYCNILRIPFPGIMLDLP
jgi:hypothetical protein